jgi:hypothetical protein
MADWPFSDAPNVAVIANTLIINRREWIAYVSHDEDDGAWQFHTADRNPPQESDVALVSLRNIVELDPTVSELADLPLGWHAWRDSPTAEWRQAPIT